MPVISRIERDFARWDELLALITNAFAYMDGVIDPPSSATRLTADQLKLKASDELGFVAEDHGRLVGCVFASVRPHNVYIGKLAIAADCQRRGIGKELMTHVINFARDAQKFELELQVRVELIGNQAAFQRMGFREVARTAHAGFDRPTSITMRKDLM